MIEKLRGIPDRHKLHTTERAGDLIAEIQTLSLGEFDQVLRVVRMILRVLDSETSILLSST